MANQRTSGSAGGRPRIDPDPLAVAIPDRKLTAQWDGAQFIGDTEITAWAYAYAAAAHIFAVSPTVGEVVCGTDSPDAIMASLLAACGGRGVVLGSPTGVSWVNPAT